MKSEKEIRNEIETVEAEYLSLAQRHNSNDLSPDFRFAKLHRLNALKWVLENDR